VGENQRLPSVPRPSAVLLVLALAAPHAGAEESFAPFTEEAVARGLLFTPVQFGGAHGRGVGFMDLDGDDDPDFVATGGSQGEIGIFENLGGTFLDRTGEAALPLVPNAGSLAGADYDGDGDIDVFVGVNPGTNLLLRNDGGWSFTDVAAEAGLDDDGSASGAVWGDYNGDGLLDLYFSRDPGWNRLYRNNGDGTFDEVAQELGVACPTDLSPTFQPSFSDVDRDGDLDLFVASDRGPANNCTDHNWLFLNNGDGTFTDVSTPFEPGWCIWGMGVATGDFDNDLLPDFYVTNLPTGHALLMNQGDGTLVDEAAQFGVLGFQLGWGAVFVDFDNDGWQEAYACHSFTGPTPGVNMLFRHAGSFSAEDIAPDVGVDVAGGSYCLATADVDQDGDVDMVVQTYPDPLRLFINNEGTNRNAVRFRMVGEGANLHAIGANMELFAGGLTMFREVKAGANHKSQNELTLHFGLDSHQLAQAATATWPGQITRTFTNIPADETWRIYPPSRLGDANADGVWDETDLSAFEACFGEGGEPLTTGCELFDFDGNWILDQVDEDAMNALVNLCPPDFNGDGVLNIFDFIAFQNAVTTGEPGADFNGDGTLNILDFIAFQEAFSEGC